MYTIELDRLPLQLHIQDARLLTSVFGTWRVTISFPATASNRPINSGLGTVDSRELSLGSQSHSRINSLCVCVRVPFEYEPSVNRETAAAVAAMA